jgi:hypothetical protein
LRRLEPAAETLHPKGRQGRGNRGIARMRALTVEPGLANSIALEDVPPMATSIPPWISRNELGPA